MLCKLVKKLFCTMHHFIQLSKFFTKLNLILDLKIRFSSPALLAVCASFSLLCESKNAGVCFIRVLCAECLQNDLYEPENVKLSLIELCVRNAFRMTFVRVGECQRAKLSCQNDLCEPENVKLPVRFLNIRLSFKYLFTT